MPTTTFGLARNGSLGPKNRRPLIHLLGLITLCSLLGLELGSLNVPQAYAQTPNQPYTSASVDESCHQTFYSSDGNPFPLCPGPYPGGGNCTWWGWEQWHLLGYNLPLNWGNAADWVVDAEWTGLPVGKTPRVGAIAVFPRADGVWAYSAAGHLAFVTGVSSDGSSFNVTYQNYGDPKPMYQGFGYNISTINAQRYQNGELRFLYFPRLINPDLFLHLKGVDASDLAGVAQANLQLTTTQNSLFYNNPLTLGLPRSSSDQEYNADFTGSGLSDLLLYDRQHGSLDIVSLSNTVANPRFAGDETRISPNALIVPQRFQLRDAKTPVNGWGSNLDIHVGNFSGGNQSDILLYDHVTGKIQLISLTPQFTIRKHVTLPGWGPGWELYVGRFDGQRTGVFLYNRYANTNTTVKPVQSASSAGLTGSTLDEWRILGRTANVVVLDFNVDFSIRHMQQFNRWHNSWEVYVGRFDTANQDGVFLYDRTIGEARTLDFNADLSINNYQELHNLVGNWEVHSGDFDGSGRAQVLLYDPSRGNGQFLVFKRDLSLQRQQSYSGWPVNDVFYVGHFGSPMVNGIPVLNAMLYDAQAGTSTFVVFNFALKIMQLHTVQSWDQHWQILIGSFVDRSRCLANGTCSTGDDILVLNRQTGEVQQYAFSFGQILQVPLNPGQVPDGNITSSSVRVRQVDTTSFTVLATFATGIRGQELY